MQLRRGNRERARGHFQAALATARNSMERRFLQQRLAASELESKQLAAIAELWEPNLAAIHAQADEG
jgi:hypothetical protein